MRKGGAKEGRARRGGEERIVEDSKGKSRQTDERMGRGTVHTQQVLLVCSTGDASTGIQGLQRMVRPRCARGSSITNGFIRTLGSDRRCGCFFIDNAWGGADWCTRSSVSLLVTAVQIRTQIHQAKTWPSKGRFKRGVHTKTVLRGVHHKATQVPNLLEQRRDAHRVQKVPAMTT